MMKDVRQTEDARNDSNSQRNDNSSFTFRAPKSKPLPKLSGQPCKLTIVNTEMHGKRLTIAQDVLEVIGTQDDVQIAIVENGIAIGSNLSVNNTKFFLRKSGRKGVIYSSELVDELTELFELDFSEKTSISFAEVLYHDIDDQTAAIFILKHQTDLNAIDVDLAMSNVDEADNQE
ncbi:hypothetical protein [Ammoniphilus sp. CFH 90114]|uniref:hypothetical protein n=1 Tax=Ammoniphilus sp. CFH 90114 TaxID=2493665 RepID=UPI00100EE781|nr:hypothetical protein [Ammoniphilus sp. CFH 90114]RXT08850.1 hypothetical protein EIZ39_08600 [Ammoniphilus sp. CFH 90114]